MTLGNFLGAKHWVGFKPQAVAGTPETTVTTFLVSESVNADANPKPIDRKSYIGTGIDLPSRVGTIAPSGKSPAEVHASQPQPWYWLLGNVVTTQPAVGTDPTVFLHTITDDSLAGAEQNDGQPVNLTGEVNRVFDQVKQGDVRLNKLKLSVAPGEIGKLEVEWMGLTHTDGATLTSTPVFVTDVLTCRAVSVSVGAVDVTVTSLDYEYSNNLEQVPTLEDADGAPHVVHRKSPPAGTGSLKWIDFPAAQLAIFRAQTTFAIIVELDGDTISSTYKKFLRITLPACQYTGGLAPSIGADAITGEANFASKYDTTTSRQILVEAQNTISTINT